MIKINLIDLKKKCTGECGLFKSLKDFAIESHAPYGVTYLCKICRNKQNKIYRNKNKEIIKEKLFTRHHNNPGFSLLAHAKMRAKMRAKENNLNFTIELSDIIIPKICPVLDIPLFITPGKRTDNSPSLDRADNTKG